MLNTNIVIVLPTVIMPPITLWDMGLLTPIVVELFLELQE